MNNKKVVYRLKKKYKIILILLLIILSIYLFIKISDYIVEVNEKNFNNYINNINK